MLRMLIVVDCFILERFRCVSFAVEKKEGGKKKKFFVASIKNKGKFITFAEDRNRAFLRHLVGRRRP